MPKKLESTARNGSMERVVSQGADIVARFETVVAVVGATMAQKTVRRRVGF